jgi:predicted HTH transcriptional regulator
LTVGHIGWVDLLAVHTSNCPHLFADSQPFSDSFLQILSQNPATNPSEIAEQIGKSRQTVYDYFDELEAAGKLHRNGSMNVIR